MNPNQYNGWLVSTSFLKRCFAVLGHMLVAQIIIAIPIWIILFIVFALFIHAVPTTQLTTSTTSTIPSAQVQY